MRTILAIGLAAALWLPGDAAGQILKSAYAGYPSHLEIVDAALKIAVEAGFTESDVSADDLRSRLECGAYEEDFAMIPGVPGEHFPAPWTKGPDFPFGGLLPLSKIPYGVLTDPWSGWYRGLSHGYDPLTGFQWPGAAATTLGWANSANNAFSWDNAVSLYNGGHRAEAYECLGHVLHLLMDLSVPAHVKLVNHGAVFTKKASGYVWDPDLVSITIDEYEMALSGGLESNFLTLIPDLHGIFTTALSRAQASRIPDFSRWSDYLSEMALLAANNTDVKAYYQAPEESGKFGLYMNSAGGITVPAQLGSIIGPGLIGDRYTQVALYCTASLSGGTVIPHQALEAMCDSLVPRAAEFSAGLILLFQKTVATLVVVAATGDLGPSSFTLLQNFPNPFNATTTIRFSLPRQSHMTLKVYDTRGQLISTLANGDMQSGDHELKFDGTDLASGAYFYCVEAGGSVKTKRLLLVK